MVAHNWDSENLKNIKKGNKKWKHKTKSFLNIAGVRKMPNLKIDLNIF